MTEVAEREPDAIEAANIPTRVSPLVRVDCVHRNRAGSRWCNWEVIFPEGGVVADLSDPSIWSRVQDHRNSALRQGDELRVRAFDRSWVADCYVAHATTTAVILVVKTVIELPEQRENLYQDDLYAVRFVGNGYSVFRKRDDHRMRPDAFPSPAAAQDVLLNWYPKRVA